MGEPGPGEARVRHTAVGLNFVDVYYRTGLYKAPSLPFTPGSEAAGVVEAVGPGVTDLRPGMRVAYGSAPHGLVRAKRAWCRRTALVPLPDGIDDRTAAAMMLKGMTAWYLLHRTVTVKPGDTILLHAAAGGVGLIASQWARELGATVIGTVGNDEKAELARAHGCHHVIVYTRENFVERVQRDHRRRRRPRRLRLGRPRHVPGLARLPAAARACWPCSASRPGPCRRSTRACSPAPRSS